MKSLEERLEQGARPIKGRVPFRIDESMRVRFKPSSTKLPASFYSLDSPETRLHDDAFYVKEEERGWHRVWVAVPAVSEHFVFRFKDLPKDGSIHLSGKGKKSLSGRRHAYIVEALANTSTMDGIPFVTDLRAYFGRINCVPISHVPRTYLPSGKVIQSPYPVVWPWLARRLKQSTHTTTTQKGIEHLMFLQWAINARLLAERGQSAPYGSVFSQYGKEFVGYSAEPIGGDDTVAASSPLRVSRDRAGLYQASAIVGSKHRPRSDGEMRSYVAYLNRNMGSGVSVLPHAA